MINILKNKPIIINTDLDGIISGLILKKYLNCKIIGFSNSADKVWLDESFNIDKLKDFCFVDMYVANPEIIVIDQHIISVNQEQHKILEKNPNKINPNLLNMRCFLPNESYYKKYPFGTVHFIVALLEGNGFDLENLALQQSIQGLSFMDLILRADDTMKTTIDSNYMENAKEWWQWLSELSNQGQVTRQFSNYLCNLPEGYAAKKKQEIANHLTNYPFNCDTPDGGVKNITEADYLKDSVKKYFQFISDVSNIELFNLNKCFKEHLIGKTYRVTLTSKFHDDFIKNNQIKDKDIFSYAFVRTSNRDKNFSCTILNE